jgi:hypothetical protein
MSTTTLNGLPEFEVFRREDETGEVVLKISVGDFDEIEISVGTFSSDADELASALERGVAEVHDLISEWEDLPDTEGDGFVVEDRGGYLVTLETQHPAGMPRDGYPSRDIATYELAKLMADAGVFPNAWYQNERGNTENIGDAVRAYHDEGGDKLLPLEGVQYEDGALVAVETEPQLYTRMTVVHDYGRLGIIMDHYGEAQLIEDTDRGRVHAEDDEAE